MKTDLGARQVSWNIPQPPFHRYLVTGNQKWNIIRQSSLNEVMSNFIDMLLSCELKGDFYRKAWKQFLSLNCYFVCICTGKRIIELLVELFRDWAFLPGGWFSKKMQSHQYKKYHFRDKKILRPSYLHNGISYTGKMASLYWIRAHSRIEKTTLLHPFQPVTRAILTAVTTKMAASLTRTIVTARFNVQMALMKPTILVQVSAISLNGACYSVGHFWTLY